MKTLILTVCVLMATISSSFAQLKVTIKEETKAMSKGSFNALVMELPGTSTKDVGNAWKKFVKKYKGKTKFDRKMNESFTDNALIKDLNDNTVDITAKFELMASDGGSTFSLWINLGATYLSSKDYPAIYPTAEALMKDFADEVSADMIKEELKVQEKILKDKEKELAQLEKAKADLEKAIEEYKATIKKMQDNIAQGETDCKTNVEEQSAKTVEIETQKKVIAEIQARLDSLK